MHLKTDGACSSTVNFFQLSNPTVEEHVILFDFAICDGHFFTETHLKCLKLKYTWGIKDEDKSSEDLACQFGFILHFSVSYCVVSLKLWRFLTISGYFCRLCLVNTTAEDVSTPEPPVSLSNNISGKLLGGKDVTNNFTENFKSASDLKPSEVPVSDSVEKDSVKGLEGPSLAEGLVGEVVSQNSGIANE